MNDPATEVRAHADELDLVRRCCEEVGLDPHRDAEEVLAAVDCPPERECCDSACDPCVLTIVRAASLVRQRRTAGAS